VKRRDQVLAYAVLLLALVAVTYAVCRPRGPGGSTVHVTVSQVPEPVETPAPDSMPVVVEDERPEPPCEGLGEDASLRCVLDTPEDAARWSLEPFSGATLDKAERAARRQREGA